MALGLIEACVERGVPIFGICRGFQEMNVAFGGSLHPEIREIPGRMNLSHAAAREWRSASRSHGGVRRPPRGEAGTGGLLRHAAGMRCIRLVNSLHGQGILDPGSALPLRAWRKKTARSKRSASPMHPASPSASSGTREYDPQTNPFNRKLFQAFGAALRERAES